MPLPRQPLTLTLASVLALALCVPAAAKIYKWTDEQGNVHFSDEPPPEGAEQLDLPPLPTYQAPQRPISGGLERRVQQPEPEPRGYQRLAIASPGREATIRGVQQTITVNVVVEPPLRPGHSVEILYDGERAAVGARTRFRISPVYRGAHTLAAVIRDADGRVVARSETITFYKHQPTVN